MKYLVGVQVLQMGDVWQHKAESHGAPMSTHGGQYRTHTVHPCLHMGGSTVLTRCTHVYTRGASTTRRKRGGGGGGRGGEGGAVLHKGGSTVPKDLSSL